MIRSEGLEDNAVTATIPHVSTTPIGRARPPKPDHEQPIHRQTEAYHGVGSLDRQRA